MVGHIPLKDSILVRFQVSQPTRARLSRSRCVIFRAILKNSSKLKETYSPWNPNFWKVCAWLVGYNKNMLDTEIQKAPSIEKFHFCRVCGFDFVDTYPWGEDGKNSTFEICDCCGTEAGYEDMTIPSIHTQREKWISSGYVWFNPKMKPENWLVSEQLKNLPQEYI